MFRTNSSGESIRAIPKRGRNEVNGTGRRLLRAGQAFGFEAAHVDVDKQLHGDGASAVDEHVPGSASAIGQKGLVPFIPTGHECGAEQRQHCIRQEA